MLTSFFSKSTPLNYVLLSITLIMGYFLRLFLFESIEFNVLELPEHIGVITIMVFTLLLLDFIIRKNNVTKKNTFAIFIFTLLILMVPSAYQDINILFSNLFLLLSTRRILSLNSDKNREKKIFDAGMYIAIASLFYFLSLAYIIVLFVGIINKTERKGRYFLIPIIAFGAIFILNLTVHLVINDSINWFNSWSTFIDFNYTSYNSLALIVPVILMLGLIVSTGSVRLFVLHTLSKKEKPAASSMVVISIVLLLITLFGFHNNGSELLFLMMPVAISTTNYIEFATTKERAIFNELVLWLILILTVVIHIL